MRLDRLDPDRAVIARIGRIQRRLALRDVFPVEIAAVDDERRRSRCRGRRDISSSNKRRSPRHDRTAAQRIGAAVLSMISGMPSSRPIAATSAIGNTVELRIGQRLGVIGAGAIVGGAAEILRIGRIDEAHLDAPGPSACWRTGSRCRRRDRWRRRHCRRRARGSGSRSADAACPEASARAATPPSSAATRCSSTSVVGLPMRV